MENLYEKISDSLKGRKYFALKILSSSKEGELKDKDKAVVGFEAYRSKKKKK